MIRSTPSGRADDDLCCESCGRRGLWQPADRSPCYDAWWCPACRGWSDYPTACGPQPLKILVLVDGPTVDVPGSDPRVASTEVRSACA